MQHSLVLLIVTHHIASASLQDSVQQFRRVKLVSKLGGLEHHEGSCFGAQTALVQPIYTTTLNSWCKKNININQINIKLVVLTAC